MEVMTFQFDGTGAERVMVDRGGSDPPKLLKTARGVWVSAKAEWQVNVRCVSARKLRVVVAKALSHVLGLLGRHRAKRPLRSLLNGPIAYSGIHGGQGGVKKRRNSLARIS